MGFLPVLLGTYLLTVMNQYFALLPLPPSLPTCRTLHDVCFHGPLTWHARPRLLCRVVFTRSAAAADVRAAASVTSVESIMWHRAHCGCVVLRVRYRSTTHKDRTVYYLLHAAACVRYCFSLTTRRSKANVQRQSRSKEGHKHCRLNLKTTTTRPGSVKGSMLIMWP